MVWPEHRTIDSELKKAFPAHCSLLTAHCSLLTAHWERSTSTSTRPPANAPSLVMDRSGIASRMAAVGLPATRSHDAEWLFFFGRVLYKSIIRGWRRCREESMCRFWRSLTGDPLVQLHSIKCPLMRRTRQIEFRHSGRAFGPESRLFPLSDTLLCGPLLRVSFTRFRAHYWHEFRGMATPSFPGANLCEADFKRISHRRNQPGVRGAWIRHPFRKLGAALPSLRVCPL